MRVGGVLGRVCVLAAAPRPAVHVPRSRATKLHLNRVLQSLECSLSIVSFKYIEVHAVDEVSGLGHSDVGDLPATGVDQVALSVEVG